MVDVSTPSYPRVDLTSSIITTGLSYISTSSPTDPSNPFVITYDVKDNANPPNAARTVTRRVFVVCPSPEFICPNTGGQDTQLQCSSSRICGVASTPTASTPSSSNTAPAAALTNYSITLNGPSSVTINLGAQYRPCFSALNINCDLGATATLLSPGDYTNSIVACANQVAPGVRLLPYPQSGLSYCSFQTTIAGTYNITFSLILGSSSTGGSSPRVNRTLIVIPECLAGEYLCGVSCCELATSSQSSSSGNNSSAPSGSIGGVSAASPPPPAPVQATLALSSLSPTTVKVKRGAAYLRCSPGQIFSSDAPCETGAVASDPNDSTIQSRVLMCPSSNCLASASSCQGERYLDKQPTDCGFDSTAFVGTSFQLQFMVYDSYGRQFIVNRTLSVISPCTSQQFYCSNQCSNVSHLIRPV